jgi:FKBP-type peptidyl-prolyl cis-trans isomerase 2
MKIENDKVVSFHYTLKNEGKKEAASLRKNPKHPLLHF